MNHDRRLVEALSRFRTSPFNGEVFRTTTRGRDPTTPSTRGGRWAPAGEVPVLYTSVERDGSIAEKTFYLSQLTPLPTKPVVVHRLRLSTRKTLRLVVSDLTKLSVDMALYQSIEYTRTQEIGAAIAYLGYDGLLGPSARWNCENLMLFADNHSLEDRLELIESVEVDWQAWGRKNGFLDP